MRLPRRNQAELLDVRAYEDLDELRQNLDDMARYARALGIPRHLKRLLPSHLTSILDVGCGSGELLAALAQELGAWCVGVDRDAAVVSLARQGAGARCRFVRADGVRLPFEASSFDGVVCVHTLHHLSSDDAAHLLAECARVARRRVVCVDLERSLVGLVGAWLLTRLTSRNRLTRADGVTSVRRAYTLQEARCLARAAGWKRFEAHRLGAAGYALVLKCPAAS